MTTISGSNKKQNSKYYRKTKELAAKAGIPVKVYRARQYASVGWNYALEVIRKRCRKNGMVCDITSSDLKTLWLTQNGVCPITGWEMDLRKTGNGLTMKTVTIDRIDPTRGYTRDNIRLVSFAANNARYTWSDDAFYKLCLDVVNHQQTIINYCDMLGDE